MTTTNLLPLEFCLVIQYKESSQTDAPRYLDKDQTNALLQEIGQNIATQFPKMQETGLIGIGSIYHLNQIIRPNFPIYTQLFELAKVRFRAKNFKPLIVGIGTEAEKFDIDIFNKETSEFKEVLQVLPFLTVMPDNDEARAFFDELNESLTTNTPLSNAMTERLESLFGLEIDNISIATLADINGLFAAQLIQIGLEELWHIIKAVIFNLSEELQTLGSGHVLYWKLDEVVILTAHEKIFDEAMRDYQQNFETYRTTTLRLEHLFKSHRIPFTRQEVMDVEFFKAPATVERVREQIGSHIKAL